MKRKFLLVLAMVLAVSLCALALSACDVKDDVTDDTNHSDTNHKWSEGIVIKKPTCTEEGSQVLLCLVCGETKTESIAATEHEKSDWYHDDNNHWRFCLICNVKLDESNHVGTGTCEICGQLIPTKGLAYKIVNDHAEVVGIGTATDTDIVIANIYQGKSVMSIGDYAFRGCSCLTSITIPNSVTSIGENAFWDCSGLTNITIPNSVTSIGYYAFYGCSGLESIEVAEGNSVYHSSGNCLIETASKTLIAGCKNSVIPSDGSVTSIGDYAFCGCRGLTSITIPNGVTSIGDYAFCGCSGLTSITIGNSVTSIGYYAFSGCRGLTRITIPNSVTSIGSRAFYNCSRLTNITIPNSVSSIGNFAFDSCSGLISIIIPNSVTSIGYYAFYGCSGLESIEVAEGNSVYHSSGNCLIETASKTLILGCKNSVIPSDGSVTSIGNYAFYDCDGLTSITISNSVTSIGNYSFESCSGLTSVTIGNSVTSIGESAFGWCSSLTNITIGNSVTSIGDHAFSNCISLTSITIPNSVTSIGDSAFRGCHMLVEVINNSTLSITKGSTDNGYVAFYALNVKKGGTSEIVNQNGYLFYTANGTNYLLGYTSAENDLTLPENYNGSSYQINNFAFYGCSGLTSITIPNSVTSIGDHAFWGCSGLTSITIPDSVTSIGDYAFSSCWKLVEVINNSTLNITKGDYDNGYVANNALNVKNGGTSEIVNQNGYLFYTAGGTNYLLGYTGAEKDLTLPDNYNGANYEIYKYAFYGCSSLTSITIPDSVTSIGKYAFYYCTSLTSITIPNSVTSIGDDAFYHCTGLTSITIPNSVTSIGYDAFRGCSGLASITIPNSVTSIGNSAFTGCSKLTDIYCEATSQPSGWDSDWKYDCSATVHWGYEG